MGFALVALHAALPDVLHVPKEAVALVEGRSDLAVCGEHEHLALGGVGSDEDQCLAQSQAGHLEVGDEPGQFLVVGAGVAEQVFEVGLAERASIEIYLYVLIFVQRSLH